MICPACGALGGANDAACRACGAALTPPDDEVTVVLRPRDAASSTTPAAAPAEAPGPAPLPVVSTRKPTLVISLDDEPGLAELPPPAAPRAPAPAAIEPAPPAPWIAAPPSGPPELPPGPPGDAGGSPWRRRSVQGGIAAMALVVALIIGWLALRPSGGDKVAAGSVLQAGQVRVTRIAARAGSATRLLSLRTIGRDANAAAQELSAQDAALSQIGDEQFRTEVAAVVQAQRRYLTTMAGLQRLNRAAATKEGVPTASALVAAATTAARQLETAQQTVATRNPAGATTVDTKALRQAGERVQATALGAHDQLVRFDRAMASYRRAVAAARARAATVTRYRDGVLSILSGYEQDRTRVDQAASRVNAMETEEAFDTFNAFKSDRGATIEQLNGSVPGAPATAQAASAHRALIAPVTTSLQGLDAALDAISAADFDDEPVTSEPQWRSFQDSSDAVAEQLGRAKSTWLTLVNELAAEALRHGVPPRPKAPDV